MTQGKSFLMHEDQLCWLEDLPLAFVKLMTRPQGQEFSVDGQSEMVQVRNLKQFTNEHITNNIWRSWSVYSNSACSHFLGPIPLVFDIDDENEELENAHVLTKACIKLLEQCNDWVESNNRIRIVFSGRKGLHVEVKPSKPIDAERVREDILESIARETGLTRKGPNTFIDRTTLDPFHEFIRVTGSYNSWDKNGVIWKRKVIPLTPEECLNLSMDEIISLSEAA